MNYDLGFGDTLLQRFIQGRIEGYEEPQRRGTPKGDKIGFPLPKYAAAVLSLTNFGQKEIAARVGVSYGVLLKWRTEEAFKHETDTHVRDFVGKLLGYIEEAEKRLEPLGSGFKQPNPGAMAVIPRATKRWLASLATAGASAARRSGGNIPLPPCPDPRAPGFSLAPAKLPPT